MKEFGSDFHFVELLKNGKSLFDFYSRTNLYANGRQAIQALIYSEGWRRIWMPDYFCYDIIDSIMKTGIEIIFYHDNPLTDDSLVISNLNFEKGDVLFRMNYFGLRAFRDNNNISVPVIEDHSHDLMGDWPRKSNADWCIASVRKTLPLPEGGILWSPIGHKLPRLPIQSEKNILLVEKRWEAMRLKKDYLVNKVTDKTKFRKLFISTESEFEELDIHPITEDCRDYLEKFDLEWWTKRKQENWHILSGGRFNKCEVLKRESEDCYNFSLTLLFDTQDARDIARQKLIVSDVYPAILWDIPEDKPESKRIADRMLSIACDSRYEVSEIEILKTRITEALNND